MKQKRKKQNQKIISKNDKNILIFDKYGIIMQLSPEDQAVTAFLYGGKCYETDEACKADKRDS